MAGVKSLIESFEGNKGGPAPTRAKTVSTPARLILKPHPDVSKYTPRTDQEQMKQFSVSENTAQLYRELTSFQTKLVKVEGPTKLNSTMNADGFEEVTKPSVAKDSTPPKVTLTPFEPSSAPLKPGNSVSTLDLKDPKHTKFTTSPIPICELPRVAEHNNNESRKVSNREENLDTVQKRSSDSKSVLEDIDSLIAEMLDILKPKSVEPTSGPEKTDTIKDRNLDVIGEEAHNIIDTNAVTEQERPILGFQINKTVPLTPLSAEEQSSEGNSPEMQPERVLDHLELTSVWMSRYLESPPYPKRRNSLVTWWNIPPTSIRHPRIQG